VAVSKLDLISFLLLFGGFGWLALIFALQLGGRHELWFVIVQNLIGGLLILPGIASLLEMVPKILRHAGVGWRFIVFFDVIPYLLFSARVWWLCVGRRPG
jgi:hypothetical protein